MAAATSAGVARRRAGTMSVEASRTAGEPCRTTREGISSKNAGYLPPRIQPLHTYPSPTRHVRASPPPLPAHSPSPESTGSRFL